jgi:hypothetical protein
VGGGRAVGCGGGRHVLKMQYMESKMLTPGDGKGVAGDRTLDETHPGAWA